LRAVFVAAAVLLFFAGGAYAVGSSENAASQPRILAVELDNDINPVTQEYLDGQLDRAEDDDFSTRPAA
jgi:membrane-bound ClpP family serine protease